MSAARTARRRRKQMSSNNAQWSGMGIPRYHKPGDSGARAAREARKIARWKAMGSTGGGKKS